MSDNELTFDNSPWVIPIYKESGPTSFDVIRDLKGPIFSILGKGRGRRKLKVGHFGTLDPFAEGLLLVGTGKALKLMSYFQKEMTKTYYGVGSISFSTDTGDREGQKLKDSKNECLSKGTIDLLSEKANSFIGEYRQRPPYFSAVKHEGRPLYELAREGIYIDKDPVERFIHKFEVLEQLNEDEFSFRCEVSSGTYIRGLWCDLVSSIGLEGHLTQLKREKWGSIDSSNGQVAPFGDLTLNSFKKVDELWDLPKVVLDQKRATHFRQGQFLKMEEPPPRFSWVYGPVGELLGLGGPVEKDPHDKMKVVVSLT